MRITDKVMMWFLMEQHKIKDEKEERALHKKDDLTIETIPYKNGESKERFAQILLYILIVITSVIALVLISQGVFNHSSLLFVILAIPIGMVTAMSVIFTGDRIPWRKWLRLERKPKWKDVFIGGIVGLSFFMILQASSIIMNYLGIIDVGDASSAMIQNSESWERIIVLSLILPIILPIIEESFFRGGMNSLLTRFIGNKEKRFLKILNKNSIRTGIVFTVSSSIFALTHLSSDSPMLYIFIVFFIFGILQSNAMRIRNSLYPAIFSHMVYNILTVGVIILV